MKKYLKDKCKGENGAILILSAVVMTVLICFLALTIDYGYIYYQNAKLQNATDAAVTAAAATPDATEKSCKEVALRYLYLNGYDKDKYDDEDFNVDVTTKVVYPNGDDTNAPNYYVKVVVDVDTHGFFTSAMGVGSSRIHREAFAKCTSYYGTGMPEALKYTLFAASTEGTQANPAIDISGKLQENGLTNAFDQVVSGVENVINGAYDIYYKISNWLKLPNYGPNDFVHLNTSETIVNNNVHSNSTIDISTQALNVTRLKDGLNEDNSIDDDSGVAGENYGQVIFDAVKGIKFSSNKRNGLTHIYVQNSDCVSKTQETLKLLKMNPSNLTQYEGLIATELADGNIFESLASQVSTVDNGGQKNNITINNDSINLANQYSIVYDVGQQTANQMLAEKDADGWEKTVANATSQDTLGAAYQDENKKNGTFTKSAETEEEYGTPTKAITISGTQINRQLENDYFSTSSNQYKISYANAKIAMATAFQQNKGWDGYIATPDMNLYFTRQLVKSLRQTSGDFTIKNKGDADTVLNKYLSIFKTAYEKQIAGNGKYYDTTKQGADDMINLLNVNTKAGYSEPLVAVKDRSKILGYTVFNTNSDGDITSARTAKNLITEGYNKLQYDENGSGSANEAKRLTDEDAVELFKKNIALGNQTYEEKKAAIQKQYNLGMISSSIKTKPANVPSRTVNTTVDSKSANTQAENVNVNKIIADHPAKEQTVKSFDFSSININKNFLNKDDGSTGTSSSADTPYNRLLSEWKNAHLDDAYATYMPTLNGFNVTFPSGANTSDFGYSSDSGNKSTKETLDVGDGYYTQLKTSKNFWGTSYSIGINDNNKVIVNGNVDSCKNIDVKANSILVVFGSVDASETIIVRENAKLFVVGTLDGKRIEMNQNSEVYCSGTAWIDELAEFGDNYKIVVNGNADFSGGDSKLTTVSRGSVYVTGEFKTDRLDLTGNGKIVTGSFLNVENSGNVGVHIYSNTMYVMNNYTNYYTTYNDTNLYIGGDAVLGSSKVKDSNSIQLTTASNTYVGGTLDCGKYNLWMPNAGTSTGTFSVYGNGASGTSNIVACNEFAFYAGGVNVYVYGDSDSTSVVASNAVTNSGNMYLFGSLQTNQLLSGINQNNDEFSSSTLSVARNIYASGDFKNYGTVYCNGYLTTSKTLTNTNKIYAKSNLSASTLNNSGRIESVGNITGMSSINSTSEIYCGGDYKSSGSLTQSASATIMGSITSSGSMNLGGTIYCGSYIDFEGDSNFNGIIYSRSMVNSNQASLYVASGAAVYIPSTFTAKNLTNNGYIAATDTITLTGNLVSTYFTYTNGNINVSGSIQNSGSTSKLLATGYIKAGAKVTIDSGLIVANDYIYGSKELVNNGNIYSLSYVKFEDSISGTGNIYAQSYVQSKTISVTGGIYAAGSIEATSGALSITGGATASNHISATTSLSGGDVTLGGAVNVAGYVSASGYLTINSGSTAIITDFINSSGTVATKTDEIGGTVYCGNYISVKTNLRNTGNIYCKKFIETKLLSNYSDVTNTGTIICGEYLNSDDLTNSGDITLGGALTSSTCTSSAGSIYAVGNCTLGKIANSGEIYISGAVTSRLGFSNSGVFGCMGGLDSSLGSFTNSGKVYIYGSVSSMAVSANSAGCTYVANNFDASIYKIDVSGGHTFVVLGKIKAKTVSSTGGSKIYAVVACNTSGGFTLDSSSEDKVSELFCGPESEKMDDYELNINGKFYFPNVTGSWSFNRVDIGQYGNATFNCDVKICKYLLVEDGGQLYVGGDTVLSGCSLTLEGTAKAYFMGKLQLDESNRFTIKKGLTSYYYNMKLSDQSTLYCGGGADYQMKFSGFFQVRGTAVFDCSITTSGFYASSGVNENIVSGLFEANSTTLISGDLHCNGNGIYVMENSVLNVKGNVDYGVCLYNANKMLAYGGITMNQHMDYKNYDSGKYNESKGRDGDYFALRSGYVNTSTQNNPNTIIYNGNRDQTLTIGGGFQNYGTYYSEGGLHTTEGHNYIGLNFQSGSSSFFGGSLTNGWSTAIRNNTVVMCDGDYTTSRATKINIDENTDDNDQYSTCYTYIGGNFVGNTNWQTVGGSNSNSSRDLDVYSNSNVLIRGSAFVNSKLYLKQNVSFVVCGEKNTTQHKNYALYISQCIDQNICTNLATGGSMFVMNTAKIRDMTKTYINGDLTVTNYLEVGKAINETDPKGSGKDETLASTNRYKAKGETKSKYVFSNAAMLSTKGNIYATKYCKIYASSTVKAGGDFTTLEYLTLRHDSKLYVGKKCKATKTIDGGSFSQFHIGGSLQAESSTIKIRDNCIVDVGGNLYSNDYIELGKKGDYTREVVGTTVTEYFNGSQTSQSVDEGTEVPEEGEDGSQTDASSGNASTGENEDTSDNATVDTDSELANDSTDDADGSTFFVGKSIYSYNGYIKIFHNSNVTCGGFVYTPKYLTLRSSSKLNVQPEMFGNKTYDPNAPLYGEDATLLEKLAAIVGNAFSPKTGSIYVFGSVTLNYNAAVTASYDTIIMNNPTKILENCQLVLRKDSVLYTGHDLSLVTPSFQISHEGNSTGFIGDGQVGKDDKGNSIGRPAMLYAGNDVSVATTINMKMTYIVAQNDVSLTDLYSTADNADSNAQELPNSIAALNGNIMFNAIYSKFGGLFYAPNGNLTLKGYYLEIWGSGVADTIDISTYYFALHRFQNWRTMQLMIPESSSVYLINEATYAKETVDSLDADNVNGGIEGSEGEDD